MRGAIFMLVMLAVGLIAALRTVPNTNKDRTTPNLTLHQDQNASIEKPQNQGILIAQVRSNGYAYRIFKSCDSGRAIYISAVGPRSSIDVVDNAPECSQ